MAEVRHPIDGSVLWGDTAPKASAPEQESFLYNPDEEPHGAHFNGVYVEIPAGESVEVSSTQDVVPETGDRHGERARIIEHAKTVNVHGGTAMALHLASTLSRFGVVRLSKPARNGAAMDPKEQEVVTAAGVRAKTNRVEMCQQVLLDHAKAGEKHKAAGLEWPDTELTKKAKAWLEKNAG